MKKPPFLENQIYHIYNRGVEKRDVYVDTQDYMHFIHYLFTLNDEGTPDHNLSRHMSKVEPYSYVESEKKKKTKKLLVEILVFCLMPNHYHLMLRQKVDGGIVKFMQKLGTGYTMFFNQKYDRVGSLFQGRFKAVLVEKDAHYLYLPHYIHLNPLDLMNIKDSISNIEKMKFLEQYRWSSLPDYIDSRQCQTSPLLDISSVTQREFLLDFWGEKEKCRTEIEEWIREKNKKDFQQIQKILLDY